MKVDGKHYRTIWVDPDNDKKIKIIDQRWLPHRFVVEDLTKSDEVAVAIKDMHVRGAGLIGAAAGYGMYLGCLESSLRTKDLEEFDRKVDLIGENLRSTRPTAINLEWAVMRQLNIIKKENSISEKIQASFKIANQISDGDANFCKRIGIHGLPLIKEIYESVNKPVNILTHCNAGWLAFVDYGSATAPIYAARENGIPVHVWVDETRPMNQGARLTAWEFVQNEIPHTIIVDNVGGHLMQQNMVDLIITGSDRTTYGGDVINKIGTYLKALAARDNKIPFYVAFPSSTFDWDIEDGKNVPIERRDGEEVSYIQGRNSKGKIESILLTPESSNTANYAFDLTPRHLVTGLITERGICQVNSNSVYELFPEHRK